MFLRLRNPKNPGLRPGLYSTPSGLIKVLLHSLLRRNDGEEQRGGSVKETSCRFKLKQRKRVKEVSLHRVEEVGE